MKIKLLTVVHKHKIVLNSALIIVPIIKSFVYAICHQSFRRVRDIEKHESVSLPVLVNEWEEC